MQSVTGRDTDIIADALAYAIITIERLPIEWREQSNADDMKRLLSAVAPGREQFYLTKARSHIERRGLAVDNAGKLKLAERDDTDGVVKL
jgi:hypothetical protein